MKSTNVTSTHTTHSERGKVIQLTINRNAWRGRISTSTCKMTREQAETLVQQLTKRLKGTEQ